MGLFICKYCGNSDPRYLGEKCGVIYCRKCISFRGEAVSERPFPVRGSGNLFLDYRLTDKQRAISEGIVKSFREGKDVLVHAVCGAGKTEIVFDVIQFALANKLKVGFAIPRRDVVVELFTRLSNAFRTNSVIALYGGHTEKLDADVIVLTTHQLYRYENFFDLLILDEVDAFPFKDNDVLSAFFSRSVKGSKILLTATPSGKLLKEFSSDNKRTYELLVRFHNKPIPVPSIIIRPSFLKMVYLVLKLREMISKKLPVLIFVPTIQLSTDLLRLIRIFVPGGCSLSSKTAEREETILRFKKGHLKYLVTTSVLERGVTIRDLQVIVYMSHSSVYSSSTLIQISGRVGRKSESPKGEIIFLADKRTEGQSEAIKSIERANALL